MASDNYLGRIQLDEIHTQLLYSHRGGKHLDKDISQHRNTPMSQF